jgi:uncharacterized protein
MDKFTQFFSKLSSILKKNWVVVLLLVSYLIIYLWQDSIGNWLSRPETQSLLGSALYEGWLGIVDYLSAHVLFCLVPAFFIAGAINTLVPQRSVLKYMSASSKKWLAYLVASMGGFFIQVCSCTILPLFAGIWKKGAGLGIATTFLYAGPAINLLAFVLTGQRLGWDLAIVRLILSIVFAVGVGLIMEWVFRKESATIRQEADLMTGSDEEVLAFKKPSYSKPFWIVLFAILLIGTAPINEVLKQSIIWPLVLAELIMAYRWLRANSRQAWWDETIKFAGEIVPMLLIGVFFAAVITHLIPEEEFRRYTGNNTLLANFVAVLFGAIAYFPALVEVPIAENFLRLGMHRGPLLSYLLSDPVLSLQGLLIINKLIGWKKTAVYAVAVTVLTTAAGYFYGMF